MAIGVVASAEPVGVMPWYLAAAFRRSRTSPVRANYYARGETQIIAIAATTQSDWEMTHPLTAAQLVELRSFHVEHQGCMIPFFFYEVSERGFTFDPTGVSTDGRYIARFDSDWQEEYSRPGALRALIPLKLKQLA